MASTCRDGWCGQGALCEKFSGPFDAFGALRRRRSEIEYPQRPGDDIDPGEVPIAIDQAEAIVDAAVRLAPQLDLYR